MQFELLRDTETGSELFIYWDLMSKSQCVSPCKKELTGFMTMELIRSKMIHWCLTLISNQLIKPEPAEDRLPFSYW